MLIDVIDVRPLNPYKLRLRFEDGVTGVVDLEKLIDFRGIFEPLRDDKFFAQATVDPDIGTIFWPNGADIDPDVLYALVIGEPISDLSFRAT
ncbi:MAG: DUF2442 domain-containing protein [Anaerolineae bacterium]|nr:MAG: DUF2442 domain-containing protein [Anaerolineae bacterium]